MSDTKAPTPQQILDLPMGEDNDSGAATVRGYLIALLAVVWDEGDDLNPFGNSGWKWDLYRALVTAGYVSSPFDEHGYVTRGTGFNERVASRLITSAIKALAAEGIRSSAPAEPQIAADPRSLPPGTWLEGEGMYALRWFTHPEDDHDEDRPWTAFGPWGIDERELAHDRVRGWKVLPGTPSFPAWAAQRG